MYECRRRREAPIAAPIQRQQKTYYDRLSPITLSPHPHHAWWYWDLLHRLWLDTVLLGSHRSLSGAFLLCCVHMVLTVNPVWLPYFRPEPDPSRLDMQT